MDKPITIYGEKGFGSVPVEAALTLIGVPYQVVSPSKPFDVSDDAAIAAVNPQRQVPALVFPGGEVMTESAAILIWLADRYPEARLAPPPLHRKRAAFLRWMSFVSSAIYALFWIRDDPSRADRRRGAKANACASNWPSASPLAGGSWTARSAPAATSSAASSACSTSTSPSSRAGRRRRKRFYAEAPRTGACGQRVDAEPRLAAFWAERFPFDEGWEG